MASMLNDLVAALRQEYGDEFPVGEQSLTDDQLVRAIMRSVICRKFGGYTFEVLDRLPLDQVIDIYAAAEWLAEEERRLVQQNSRR